MSFSENAFWETLIVPQIFLFFEDLYQYYILGKTNFNQVQKCSQCYPVISFGSFLCTPDTAKL